VPGRGIACDLAGHAFVCVPYEAIAGLRRQPGPVFGAPLPPAFLKHADEQTVVGLTAVYQAIHDHGLTPDPAGPGFRDWGVVAAPRFLGRPTMAASLLRFAAEGAWGVSPHLIPHRSLHSVSGTVSQALKIHGPNFGVGGGPGAAAEGILTGAAMLQDGRLPGVWVILTALEPEQAPDECGRPAAGTMCAGLALGLVAPRPCWPGIRLRVLGGSDAPLPAGAAWTAGGGAGIDVFHLHGLLARLDGSHPGPTTLVHLLDEAQGPGTRIEVSRGAPPVRGTERGTRNGEALGGGGVSLCASRPALHAGEAER
jgi:hypothetical protein